VGEKRLWKHYSVDGGSDQYHMHHHHQMFLFLVLLHICAPCRYLGRLSVNGDVMVPAKSLGMTSHTLDWSVCSNHWRCWTAACLILLHCRLKPSEWNISLFLYMDWETSYLSCGEVWVSAEDKEQLHRPFSPWFRTEAITKIWKPTLQFSYGFQKRL